MMVSAARDHYMFTKYINLVGTTIFDSEIDLCAKTFIMAMRLGCIAQFFN